jgi:hypothetical protein
MLARSAAAIRRSVSRTELTIPAFRFRDRGAGEGGGTSDTSKAATHATAAGLSPGGHRCDPRAYFQQDFRGGTIDARIECRFRGDRLATVPIGQQQERDSSINVFACWTIPFRGERQTGTIEPPTC